jgi:hypothetical protein
MKANIIEISYNAKLKQWNIKTFYGGDLISDYHYKNDAGIDFIAGLTNSMMAIRASEKDNLILNKGSKNAQNGSGKPDY